MLCTLYQFPLPVVCLCRDLRDGLGNGMKTFFPDSSNSTSDFGQYSRYLESVLHSPWQQCFVLTILGPLRKHTLRFTKLFACFLYILTLPRIHSLMADCNVCLSLAGGLMRQNLFLEFVRDAIVNVAHAKICKQEPFFDSKCYYPSQTSVDKGFFFSPLHGPLVSREMMPLHMLSC